METLIIGCKTLANEIGHVLEKTGVACDLEWLEAGLHNTPERLGAVLRQKLNNAAGYSRVVLGMGFCGNALDGLQNGACTLVVPRVDDCISLLLGSCRKRQEIAEACPSYFLTEGWLRGERNIWREYEHAMQDFGPQKGQAVLDAMFGNYKALTVIDTGCYDLQDVLHETCVVAGKLRLEHRVIPGTLSYLERLVAGPWSEEEFLWVEPYGTVRGMDLYLK